MKPRFRITPLQLLFAALLAIFGHCAQGCRDQYPDPPGIEGRWKQLTGATVPREYLLDDGLFTQETLFGSTTVASITFPYAERGDTLLIGGDENNPPRTWITRLIGDGAMEVKDRQGNFQFTYILERL